MNNHDFIVDLEDYTIIKKLEEGQYGTVYLVIEKETQKEFAAMVSKVECINASYQKEFFKELTAFSMIQSAATLSLKGFNMNNFKKERFPTIITPYMSKGSLDKLLENNSNLPLSNKFIILLGIAEGMKYLHSKSIIHRDLKCANVLLDDDLYPHIGDFGESKISELKLSMIHMQTFKGSPAYMAPEVIMDEEYNYKAEFYSYSIIFYEVFSCKSPYTGYRSIYRLLDDVKNGKRPNLNHIENEDIKNFLNRCWSSNPTERPTFAEIVEQMKSERYLQIFEVDDEFANKYLILFNDQINSEKNNLIDIETLKRKSDSGDAESILKYSDYLIKIDPIKTAQYLKLAADKGNAEVMSRYALMLKRGQGFSAPNPEMAVFYFKRAIDKGSVRAMQQYANMLRDGDGIPPNPEEAVRYYKMAIDLGDAASMNNYGYMLLHGNGIETNKELASRYFKMAIDLGDTASMNNYGGMLPHGKGIKADKEMAVHYYKMAADKGDRRGIHNYAFMLLKGWGIPENKEEAVKLFKQAADMGYVKSYRFYADIVKNGVGNAVGDAKEAARYYKIAADKGDEMAMVKYASMLESGDGINADLEKAIQYYKKAADLGNKSAKNRYEILTK